VRLVHAPQFLSPFPNLGTGYMEGRRVRPINPNTDGSPIGAILVEKPC
jgi:hypothetical protein